MLLASATKTPEVALDKEEANILAAGVAGVVEHYDFLSSVLSDKSAAWLALGQAVAIVYGPRVMAVRMRKGLERATDGL